ncbi:uncharacterized protein [Periplaneta americana]|uniref:uncharacterized protein n=1 Tax=Periplaneta americana TaxID=6978 RepID=UPI0037E87246
MAASMSVKFIAGLALFLMTVLDISLSAPTGSTSDTPMWHVPCGDTENQQSNFTIVLNKKMWIQQMGRSLRKIQHQLNITMEHYKSQMFNEVYKEVRRGVDDNQFVLNWVPGMGNVLIHFSNRPTRLQISGYLPSLHTELQTFSVAMEAVVSSEKKRSILFETNKYLIQFLCEVESALVVLQIAVPARVLRSLMSNEERYPADETQRLIRDWGILIKYKEYLNHWSLLLSKMENHHKKQKANKKATRKQKTQKTKSTKKSRSNKARTS